MRSSQCTNPNMLNFSATEIRTKKGSSQCTNPNMLNLVDDSGSEQTVPVSAQILIC